MAKPHIHAISSARRFGGVPEDYEPIHAFLDSSKIAIADNRHRALTHNSWFLTHVLERVKFANSGPETADHRFPTVINSKGKAISIREIGEQHCLEDYKGRFIPSAQDFLSEIEYRDWMQNGKDVPPSARKLKKDKEKDKEKEVELIPIVKEQFYDK